LGDEAGEEGTQAELELVVAGEYARHMGHIDLLRERIDGRIGQ
jgi:Protein of unknown function (DUF664)